MKLRNPLNIWRQNRELRTEIARLRALGMEQCKDTPIVDIDIQTGAVDIALRPPGWLIQAMASAAYDLLADAPNWRSFECGPLDHKGTVMIVTVQRKSGSAPVESSR